MSIKAILHVVFLHEIKSFEPRGHVWPTGAYSFLIGVRKDTFVGIPDLGSAGLEDEADSAFVAAAAAALIVDGIPEARRACLSGVRSCAGKPLASAGFVSVGLVDSLVALAVEGRDGVRDGLDLGSEPNVIDVAFPKGCVWRTRSMMALIVSDAPGVRTTAEVVGPGVESFRTEYDPIRA